MTYEEMEQIAGLDLSDPEQEARALAWRIDDLPTLEWAMGILAEAETEKAEIEQQTEAAIRRVTVRGSHLAARVQKRTAFMRAAVEDYARVHRADLLKGRTKTRQLVHGSIQYRATPERVEVTDPAAALAWCQEQGLGSVFVRTKYEIEKKALASHVLSTGEIPPGCEIQPAREEIVIKPEQPETITAAAPTKEISRDEE